MATSIAQNPGNRETRKNNSYFLEQASTLLLELAVIYYELQRILNDNKKLYDLSLELRRVLFIRKSIAPYYSNENAILNVLNQHLKFIGSYDVQLANFIAEHGSSSPDQPNDSSPIIGILSDFDKLISNLGLLKELVNSSTIGNKTKAAMSSVLNLSEELLELNKCIDDLRNWNLKVHTETEFYIKTIEDYFNGNDVFYGLGKFDKLLKERVANDEAMKRLRYQYQLSYRAEEQVGLIDKMIAFINQDIRNGEWVENKSTAKFVGDLERYSQIFKIRFKNILFSSTIIKNKVLGEQPFKWLELLQRMRAMIIQNSTVNDSDIQNVRAAMTDIFLKRIEEIKITMQSVATKTKRLFISEKYKGSLYATVKKGLKELERKIKALWDLRRKRFLALKADIERLSLIVMPEVDKLTQEGHIIEDASRLVENGISWNSFVRHFDSIRNILRKRSRPDYNEFAMALFDLARMEYISARFIESKNRIIEKKNRIEEYDISQIRLRIKDLINLYAEILKYYSFLKTEKKTEEITSKVNNFLRYNYV